jgi:hypothetical protein
MQCDFATLIGAWCYESEGSQQERLDAEPNRLIFRELERHLAR